MQVVVDDLLITYERSGRGKTVLLLHGWGDDHTTFDALKAYLNGYDLLALDLPGMGGSQAPEQAWDLDDFVGLISAFLKKVGVSSVYAIVGHSNGGAVAIRGLGSGALHADKLVLLSSAGIRDQGSLRKQALLGVAKSGKLASKVLPGATQQQLRKKFYGAIGSELTLLPHMEETFKRIVASDVQQDAGNIKIPTLLVYGELDTATPPSYGKLLHGRIAGSKLEMISGAGHFAHQEQTQQVGSQVAEFLGQ